MTSAQPTADAKLACPPDHGPSCPGGIELLTELLATKADD